MLRQTFEGLSRLSKVTTPLLLQTERMVSTTGPLMSEKKFDRRKDAVRQGLDDDFLPGSKGGGGADAGILSYDKYKTNPFPTQETFAQTFSGIPFSQLPIIHIKATSNNTIISATDCNGTVLAIQSGGTVGFRNARRGTNVAAQAAAIALAGDAVRKDIRTARVCLKGIGPGRLPALKAIQLSGVDVVSITDTTPLPHNGNRPKKVRRL